MAVTVLHLKCRYTRLRGEKVSSFLLIFIISDSKQPSFMPNLVMFFLKYLLLFYACAWVYAYAASTCSVCGNWNRVLGSLELELQAMGAGIWTWDTLKQQKVLINSELPFLHTYSSIICITLCLGQKSWEKLEGAMMLESQCLVSVVDKSFFLFPVVWLGPVLWKRKPSRMTLEGWGNTKGDGLDNVTATLSGEM